jgi:hypothetical protein
MFAREFEAVEGPKGYPIDVGQYDLLEYEGKVLPVVLFCYLIDNQERGWAIKTGFGS